MMKGKQKTHYKVESGIGFFLMGSKQYQKVKERNNNGFFAFPSIVTRKIDSLIKKPENINKPPQYNGTFIEKKRNSFERFRNISITHFLNLNRAEAVMAQFLPLFLYSQKKAVIYPELNKRRKKV